MKFKTIFVIHAIVPLAYGICFELVPQLMLSIYGVTQGPGEILMARYFGVALIAIGLVFWLTRDVTDAAARQDDDSRFVDLQHRRRNRLCAGNADRCDERSRLVSCRDLRVVGFGSRVPVDETGLFRLELNRSSSVQGVDPGREAVLERDDETVAEFDRNQMRPWLILATIFMTSWNSFLSPCPRRGHVFVHKTTKCLGNFESQVLIGSN